MNECLWPFAQCLFFLSTLLSFQSSNKKKVLSPWNISSPRTAEIVGLPGSIRTFYISHKFKRDESSTNNSWGLEVKRHPQLLLVSMPEKLRPFVSATCSLIIFHETEFSILIANECNVQVEEIKIINLQG